jgi:hypothetical protein
VTGQRLDIPQNFDSARLLSILGGREETLLKEMEATGRKVLLVRRGVVQLVRTPACQEIVSASRLFFMMSSERPCSRFVWGRSTD